MGKIGITAADTTIHGLANLLRIARSADAAEVVLQQDLAIIARTTRVHAPPLRTFRLGDRRLARGIGVGVEVFVQARRGVREAGEGVFGEEAAGDGVVVAGLGVEEAGGGVGFVAGEGEGVVDEVEVGGAAGVAPGVELLTGLEAAVEAEEVGGTAEGVLEVEGEAGGGAI